MKNLLKNIITIFLFATILVSLTGCSKKEEKTIDEKVIGTWKYEVEYMKATYVFKKDGTGSYTITVEDNTVEKEVDYYTKDGVLYINFDKDPDTFEIEYEITDEGMIIYDTAGEKLIYKKQ